MRRKKQNEYAMPAKAEKAEYVKRNFDEIASHYDRFNDITTYGLHRLWKKVTVRSLQVENRPGMKVLDLCCGSGDLTLTLRSRKNFQGDIYSIDFSRGMLDILEARLKKGESRSGASIYVAEGDASQLKGFPDNSIDGIMIGFGLRNVTERQNCLNEIFRVLKPDGRLAILDVGQVPYPLIAFFHRWYFQQIVPRIGHYLHGAPHEMYNYLPESAKTYPDQKRLKEELETTGFNSVNYRNFLFGATVLHRAQKPAEDAPGMTSKRESTKASRQTAISS